MRSPYEQWLYQHKQRTVVLGSFRFYKSHIIPTIDAFQACGVSVTLPAKGKVIDIDEDGYQILDVDVDTETGRPQTPAEIQTEFFAAIDDAPFVYVAAVGGYIGELVTRELVYAAAGHKPIFTSEPLAQTTINQQAHDLLPHICVATPYEAARMMLEHELPDQAWLTAKAA